MSGVSSAPAHSLIESIILFSPAIACIQRTPHSLTKFTLIALLLSAIYCSYYTSLPALWMKATRSNGCQQSGIQYGVVLLPLACISWLNYYTLMSPQADTGAMTWASFYLWSSVACSFVSVSQVYRNATTYSLQEIFVVLFSFCGFYVVTAEVDKVFSLIQMNAIVLLYQLLFRLWRTVLPKSFTVGEAMFVLQAVSLFSVDFVAYAIMTLGMFNTMPFIKRSEVQVALQGGLLGVLWLAAPLYPMFKSYGVNENETSAVDPRTSIKHSTVSGAKLINMNSRPLKVTIVFYCIIVIWLGGFVTPMLTVLMNDTNPVVWLFEFVFADPTHVYVALYWLVVLVIGLPAIQYLTTRAEVPLIIVRKLYHILSLVLFTPALIYTRELFHIASGVAVGIFLIVEYIRICRIPPFGGWLNAYLRTYTDKRDEGFVILTHLYLLLGCSASVWMFPSPQDTIPCKNEITFAVSGLFILGAADAAGAIIGYSYGTHQWIGSRKTLEGTTAAIVATMIWYCIVFPPTDTDAQNSCTTLNVFTVFCAVLVTCLLEAFTKQIDNLVLPLFFCCTLLVAAT